MSVLHGKIVSDPWYKAMVSASRQYCQVIRSFRRKPAQQVLLESQAALCVLATLVVRLPAVPEPTGRPDFDDVDDAAARFREAAEEDLPAFSKRLWAVLPSTAYDVPGHLFVLWGVQKMVLSAVDNGWATVAIAEWRSTCAAHQEAIDAVLAASLAEPWDEAWEWQDVLPHLTSDKAGEEAGGLDSWWLDVSPEEQENEGEFISSTSVLWAHFEGDTLRNRAAYAQFRLRLTQVMQGCDTVPDNGMATFQLLWHIAGEVGRAHELLPLLLQLIDRLAQQPVRDRYEQGLLDDLYRFLEDIPVTPYVPPAGRVSSVWDVIRDRIG